MAVQNRIVKIQKRNRALVTFDGDRIRRAILKAAQSIGGFGQDHLPAINGRLFDAYGDGESLAEFLAEAVVVSLNADPHHLITNFPPTIEVIQDDVLHVLRVYVFQNTGDATKLPVGPLAAPLGNAPNNSWGMVFRKNKSKRRWLGISNAAATRWRG